MEPIKSVIMGEQLAGEASKTRKQVEKLIQAHILDQFDIGDLLWKIKKNGWYTSWGYNTFIEYARTTGLKESKVRYLPQISEVMEAVGFTRDQYQGVGIAKLRAIVSLKPDDIYINPVTKDETPVADYIKLLTQKAIDDGDAFKLDEIKKHVRTLKGMVGSNDFSFLGISAQRSVLESVIRPALERAKMLIGSVGKDSDGNSLDASDSRALELICAEFLAMPVEQSSVGEAQAELYAQYTKNSEPDQIASYYPDGETE